MDLTQKPSDVMAKALLLEVRFHAWGVSRVIDSNSIDTKGASPSFISASKRLLKCKSYNKIKAHYSRLKTRLKVLSVVFPLRESTYMIPRAFVETADNMVLEAMEQLPNLVTTFVDEDYETAKQEAQEKLGPHFNPNLYPSKVEMKKLFGIEKSYQLYASPEDLQSISEKIWQRDLEDKKTSILSATSAIEAGLVATMNELVSHLFEKLSTNEGGEKKRFKAASLDNLKEFLKNLKELNITENAQLTKLGQEAEQLLEGVDPKFLREDDTVREKMAKSLETLKTNLDGMLEKIPGFIRKIK